jgi:hypothetical protein
MALPVMVIQYQHTWELTEQIIPADESGSQIKCSAQS